MEALEPIEIDVGKQEDVYFFKNDYLKCKNIYKTTGEYIKPWFPSEVSKQKIYEKVHERLGPRILQDEALTVQPDGIYCYIVFEMEGTRHIAFAHTRSGWEYGTSHVAIANALGLTELLFAGEFKKEGMSIKYNYLSGTFLQDHNTSKSPAELSEIKTLRESCMRELLTPIGFTPEYFEFPGDATESFIKTAEMPVTDEELEDLHALGLGFEAILYSRKDCLNEMKLVKNFTRADLGTRKLWKAATNAIATNASAAATAPAATAPAATATAATATASGGAGGKAERRTRRKYSKRRSSRRNRKYKH
jgi:hypothetical protein